MKIDVSIDLAEARALLVKGLQDEYSGASIGTITITSYDKPRIIFHGDGMVEASDLRHRIVAS